MARLLFILTVFVQVQTASEHALVLLNKVRAKSRSLQSLHQSRHQLCHKIAKLQVSMQAGLQHKFKPLTAYELDLLRDRDSMQSHQESLKAAASIIRSCTDAAHNACLFLQWIAGMTESCQQAKLEVDGKH